MKLRETMVLGSAILATLSLAGCGNTGSGGGSCTQTSVTLCIDYPGSSWTQATVRAACISPQVYSTGACSTSGKVAQCVVSSGAATETKYTYYSGYTTTSAQTHCTSGTFTPGG